MQRLRSLGKHLSAGALAALLGLVVVAGAGAEEDEDRTVRVDLRVWQGVRDPQEVLLSGRPSGGDARGARDLPLEQMNKRGTFRYSDRTVGVPRWRWHGVRGRARVAEHARSPAAVSLGAPLRG